MNKKWQHCSVLLIEQERTISTISIMSSWRNMVQIKNEWKKKLHQTDAVKWLYRSDSLCRNLIMQEYYQPQIYVGCGRAGLAKSVPNWALNVPTSINLDKAFLTVPSLGFSCISRLLWISSLGKLGSDVCLQQKVYNIMWY